MSHNFRFPILLAILIVLLFSTNTKTFAQGQGPVSYQEFYDQLSPYGDWVNDPDYGYAWVPDAGPDFQPYRSHGHWVYTEYGWTWVSDYKWGWATFHYGRWKLTDEFGWIWIPGYTWGPAWVSWRRTEGYYGWAPLAPPRLRYNGPGYGSDNNDYRDQGDNDEYRDESNNGGYRDDRYNGGYQEQNYSGSNFHTSIGFNFSWGNAAPVNQWCFVPANYIASPYVYNYYVPQTQNTIIYNNTTIIKNTYVNGNMVDNNGVTNNTVNIINNNSTTVNNNISKTNQKIVYIAGPPRADVEQTTGQHIQAVSIINASKPGIAGLKGNAISMYRPPFRNPVEAGKLRSAAGLPSPGHAIPINQVSPISQRQQLTSALVKNNALTHLNSTDRQPVVMARSNYSVFRSSPVKAQTIEKERYINAGTLNSNQQSLARPAPILNAKPDMQQPPVGKDGNISGGMNNPKDPRVEHSNAISQPHSDQNRTINEDRLQQQNRLRLQKSGIQNIPGGLEAKPGNSNPDQQREQNLEQQRQQIQDQQRQLSPDQQRQQIQNQQRQQIQNQQRQQMQNQQRQQMQDQERQQIQNQQRQQMQDQQRQQIQNQQRQQMQDQQRQQMQDQQRQQIQNQQRQQMQNQQRQQMQDQQRQQMQQRPPAPVIRATQQQNVPRPAPRINQAPKTESKDEKIK